MAALLRLFKRPNKWPSDDPLPWLGPDDVSADPLENLATDDNILSVFLVGDDPERIDRVLAGLVAGRTNEGEAEYILFDESLVPKAGIKMEKVEGETPDAEVNSWHRDLTEISAKKLAVLATLIVPACDPIPKLPKAVRQVLARSVVNNHIPLNAVKWQGKSLEHLNAEIATISGSAW